jgi:hypothetical protein
MNRAWRTAYGERKVSYPRSLGVWVPLLVAFVLLLGGPVVSWAHVDPPTILTVGAQAHEDVPVANSRLPSAQPVLPALSGAALTFMPLVLIAIALAWNLLRWRRVTALSLTLILGVFTFGIAIHAVHHLSEPAKAGECPVFFASQHVTGAPADTYDLYPPILAIAGLSSVRFDAPALTPAFHPAQPRAPPSFPA